MFVPQSVQMNQDSTLFFFLDCVWSRIFFGPFQVLWIIQNVSFLFKCTPKHFRIIVPWKREDGNKPTLYIDYCNSQSKLMPVSKEQIQDAFFCYLSCHRLALREQSFTVFNFTVAGLHCGPFYRVHRLLCNLFRTTHTYSTEISVVCSLLYMFPSLGLFFVGLFLCPAFSLIQCFSLSPLISQETQRQPGRVLGEAQSHWSRLGAGVQACFPQLSEI